jgi:hypothetical protein
MSSHDSAGTERGISMRAVELAVAAGVFIFGAVIVFDSVRLGARWASDGPQAGYFPFYIGLIICLCALAVFALAIADKLPGSKVFVTWTALKQVMQVLGPALIYVLGIQLIGIYLASALYIAVFMMWLGHYSFARSAAIGAGVMAAFFLMFEVWFKVALYKGLFDPLSFLGY